MKRLVINAYRCWGCRTCEETCSSKYRVSRINVVAKNKNERVPVTCLQCEDAACKLACRFGALERNDLTGAIEIDQKKCTHCYACRTACPFGNIIFDKKTADVQKCNLCGGVPECAKTCPSGTLMFE